MRRTVVGLAAFAVGLSLLPGAALASEVQPSLLAGTTTLVGAHAHRHVVQVDQPAVVDLELTADGTGRGLPSALSVTGGQGFRGFLLTEPGTLDGLVVLAVMLPEPDQAADGSSVHGTAWGRSDTGEPCARCTIPPGTYELYLLAGGLHDEAASQVEVSVRVDGLPGDVRLEATDGEPAIVLQHRGQDMTGADGALLGSGWAGSSAWKIGAPWTGLMIDQMAVTYTGRTAPPVLTRTEFCREVDGDRDCDEDTTVLSEHRLSQIGVTPFALPDGSAVSASISWDVVGDADYRAVKNVLFVDIGETPKLEAGTTDQEPEHRTLFRLS